MRKQQLRMDSGGEVACSREGASAFDADGAGGFATKTRINAGANMTDASGCGESFTLCCSFSQCFLQRPDDMKSGELEVTSEITSH